MFNRLFGYGQAPTYSDPEPDTPPLAEVTGALFATATTSGDRIQKMVYMSCVASLVPTASPHTFEIVLQRDYEPDDAEALQPARRVFPVTAGARFECEESSCGWSSRDNIRYNLDINDDQAAAEFIAALSVALFCSVHGRQPGVDDADAVRAMLNPPKLEHTSEVVISTGELVKVVGELYRYNVESSKFETIAPRVHVTINTAVVTDDGSRTYMMVVKTPEGIVVMESEVNNDMNSQFWTQTLSLVWVLSLTEDVDAETEPDPESQLCLSVKMFEADAFLKFRNQFSLCLYEVNHQASMDDHKLKEVDRNYIARSDWDDVEPMEVEKDSDAEDWEDRRSIRDELPKDRASMNDLNDGMANSHLAVSSNSDRTFVVRGNKMGVFRTGADGAKFTTSVQFKDPTRQGSTFMPSSILLHEQDRSMLVLDPNDETKLMRMDLERGEIVDTWAGPLTNNTAVKAVHRVKKYSNRDDTKEFVGLNKNALLHMDPRTKEFIVQSKKYAPSTRARLDCMATTGEGRLAVASENGDIRLYDTIGKNAKTHLPGLGDKIIGVDVTDDGRYVLATTTKYLLIINTEVHAQTTYSGFMKSMGKNKPAPRKLVIKPQDIVRYRMGEINFTPAHFNTGSSLERSIVTSTGPFLVTWNFRSIKGGVLDSYHIKRYTDTVVADEFAYNNDGKIVVTLPNDVSIATRR